MNATMKNVSERTGFPLPLLRAVARQMGGWTELRESASDISRHGIDGGFSGFIWTSDTVKFYRANKTLILDLLEQQAEELGMDPTEMVCSFNCLRTTDPKDRAELHREVWRTLGGRMSPDDYLVANAMAWYAAEEAARAVDWYQDEYGRSVA
jgi:hypothetical protein